MKIPLKYGLLITLGITVWVLLARTFVTDPESIVHRLVTPIFFNVLQFVMIYLGLKALEREIGDRPTFKHGLKTGLLISLVYGIAACLFFAVVLITIGTKWLASEPGAAGAPMSRIALTAFASLFVSALVLGLIYSTLISFFIAKRQTV